MIVPVTVTGSVVFAFCFVPFEPGWANASGASSALQMTMATRLFIIYPPVDVNDWMMTTFPLQRDSGARAARNLDFSRHLLIFCTVVTRR
jgi:hypothetical protein